MLHSTSGRQKYAMRMLNDCVPMITDKQCDSYSGCDTDLLFSTTINFTTLKMMLIRENELRLSPAIQKMYREQGYDHYFQITETLQRQVAGEFGLDELVGVNYLQCAENIVMDNAAQLNEVRNISLYRKYNRCYDGNLQEGDLAPLLSSPLYDLIATNETVQTFHTQESWYLNDCLKALYPSPVRSGDLSGSIFNAVPKAGNAHFGAMVRHARPLVIISGSYS